MSEKNNTQAVTIKLSWRSVAAILLATNIISVILWQPWNTNPATARKITVSGEAAIDAVPDEYVLSPYFEFTNADRAVATEALSKQSSAISARLKELGVKDEQVKSSTNGYDKYSYTGTPETSNTLQLQYTITLDNKDIAQKVQDYMLTLKPQGQISPVVTFSENKRKELEEQVRTKALDDARAKAEKTAAQLGSKVGKAINISDGAGYGMPMPVAYGSVGTMEARLDTSASVPVQEGQDKFRYSVSVEYELK
jgi:hypothetical protein